VTNQVETPDTVAAVRFMSIELPELLGITDTVHAGALALCGIGIGNVV
jgi:hypothetical protein